jgi:hypothetical protein
LETIHAAEEGNHNPDERLAQVHASFHSAKIELESNGAVPKKSRSATKIHIFNESCAGLWMLWERHHTMGRAACRGGNREVPVRRR